MGAAIGLAVMLLVVVAVLSVAVNAQGPLQAGPVRRAATSPGGPRRPTAPEERRGGPERPDGGAHPGGSGRSRTGRSQVARPGRRPAPEPSVDAAAPAPQPEPVPPEPEPEAPAVPGDVKPLDRQATARVMSVVDERKLGPVTKSRLTLLVEPEGPEPFEVVARVAFSSPEERAEVKVGTTVPVRYDSADHRRVVVETGRRDG